MKLYCKYLEKKKRAREPGVGTKRTQRETTIGHASGATGKKKHAKASMGAEDYVKPQKNANNPRSSKIGREWRRTWQ